MPSSCRDLREALAQCLQQSDCILVQRNKPLDCLAPPLLYTLPESCQQLKRGFSDCKRGMVDMRKRFRGNYPVNMGGAELEAGSKELQNGTAAATATATTTATANTSPSKPRQQLYAGKPVFDLPLKEGARGEVSGLGFDESKTRGL